MQQYYSGIYLLKYSYFHDTASISMSDFTEHLTFRLFSVNQTENNLKNGGWDRGVFLESVFILYFFYKERVIPNTHIPKGSVMKSQYF